MTVKKDEEYWRGWNNALDKVVELIEDAPSVLPKRSCYRCGLREDCEDSTERKPKEGEVFHGR